MSILDVIEKKKHGVRLTDEEIRKTIEDYVDGAVKDYQMSALLMAIYFQGMDRRETFSLTRSMIDSGDTVDLNAIEGPVLDKHSTGGVGDTTTLIIGPLLSAYGLPFGKMSGRGLGHTGGTLDKLEAIPGFSVDLSVEGIIEATNTAGIAVAGQTANITPADKKLYALRDATGTVDAIPLIASSIMSKKLAILGDCLLLDVKVGDGAFMKDEKEAHALADVLVDIGENFGRKTIAVLTRMEEPLGRAVGNGIEILEAIEILRGEGPEDLTELCLHLATKLILLAEGGEEAKIRARLESLLHDGTALQKFRDFVENQGGDGRVVEDFSILPRAQETLEVVSDRAGYIQALPASEIGILSRDLGAGRITMEDALDLGSGIYLTKKVGDAVREGDVLAVLYGKPGVDMKAIEQRYLKTVRIGEEKSKALPLIIDEVVYGH
ncbi:pyrimidine-nucleoside phosphorylase [Peptoniphilus ivorii]|uniref:thymidine phosphorylase n=1 Tax=Aedoeadaptatus ivorii TaxID=54006 RepID=UPI00278B68DF|nr:thymidine phosphorylase [Peptoniphilus ivorii]MDQ0507756.1 pyrimidine-nucleoside phosphorylase [Peptoniphilus ivorii]